MTLIDASTPSAPRLRLVALPAWPTPVVTVSIRLMTPLEPTSACRVMAMT
jgi:hypothetical protein